MPATTLSPDARLDRVQLATAAAAVLAKWYSSHPVVRRLWAVDEIEGIRVIVTLEPTPDGNDTLPAWLANSATWAQELRLHMQRRVRLEMIEGPSHIESACNGNGAAITEISWRDPLCG